MPLSTDQKAKLEQITEQVADAIEQLIMMEADADEDQFNRLRRANGYADSLGTTLTGLLPK